MEIYVLAATILIATLILAGTLSSRGRGGSLGREMYAHAKALDRLASQSEERRRLDEEATRAVREVQRLLAGSFSRGKAGENVIAAALEALPESMVVRDFRLGGKTCEFALRMSDGKLLPVDSKWTSSDLSKELEESADQATQSRLKKEADRVVISRIKEVAQYIDPSITLPLAVAAVPDPIFHALSKAHSEANDRGVVIVGYSQAVPHLLTIWQLHRTYSRKVDSAELLGHIGELHRTLSKLEGQIEGRLSKSLTMADNAAGELRSLVGSAMTALGAIERSEPASPSSTNREEVSRLKAI